MRNDGWMMNENVKSLKSGILLTNDQSDCPKTPIRLSFRLARNPIDQWPMTNDYYHASLSAVRLMRVFTENMTCVIEFINYIFYLMINMKELTLYFPNNIPLSLTYSYFLIIFKVGLCFWGFAPNIIIVRLINTLDI